jgi:hypothetical protein
MKPSDTLKFVTIKTIMNVHNLNSNEAILFILSHFEDKVAKSRMKKKLIQIAKTQML